MPADYEWKCEGYDCNATITEETACKGYGKSGNEYWLCLTCANKWGMSIEAEQENCHIRGMRGPLDFNVW